MHACCNIAIRAARRAGDVINRYRERLDLLHIQEKGRHDLVTEVDRLAEKEIVSILSKTYPHHRILGEEGGQYNGHSEEYEWVIDPLDGTLNYLHGFPYFAVSIALKYRGELEHGVVYDPTSQELFTASRGEGAYLNEKRIRVSNQGGLEGSLISAPSIFHTQIKNLPHHQKVLDELLALCADTRNSGSAALSLAYLAAGRLEGFWEMGLKEWDIAAGVLLVREAGGLVGDFNDQNKFLKTGDLVAGTPKVYTKLLKILNDYPGSDSSAQK